MKQVLHIYSTSKEKLVEQKIEPSINTNYHKLIMDGNSYQSIDGFGACFNELGFTTLTKLPGSKQDEILKNLFHKEECNFTHCRLPMGASDYALSWYSLNETEGDYAMDFFSIDRDKDCLIPFIKKALQYAGELDLFASPWSPPTWMKFPKVYNYGKLVWTKENLQSYALYFMKFIEAYEAEGIRINKVHIQNEPIADQKFPSCVWSGEEMKEFIRDYLGPLFEQCGIDTEIWLGTINAPYDIYGHQPNWYTTNYNCFANVVLKDKEALKYISGVGYQWGGKNAIQQTHIAYPDMKLAQTENECGDGKNSWEHAEYVYSLIWHYFINGVSSYTYWNMILEDEGNSTWGWKQNSLISVTKENTVIYNPEYYLFRHFSKYIKNGAVLLGLKGDLSANALAFRNPDNSVVLQVQNPFDESLVVSFEYEHQFYNLDLKAHSFNTIIVNE